MATFVLALIVAFFPPFRGKILTFLGCNGERLELVDREFATKVACKDGRESNLAVAWKRKVLAIIDARGT